jgi:hypothetical protein
MPTDRVRSCKKKVCHLRLQVHKKSADFKNSMFGSYPDQKLPFLDTTEDDVSFVTLGTLFGTAHLHS